MWVFHYVTIIVVIMFIYVNIVYCILPTGLDLFNYFFKLNFTFFCCTDKIPLREISSFIFQLLLPCFKM